MNYRYLAAACVALVLALAACCSSESSMTGNAGELEPAGTAPAIPAVESHPAANKADAGSPDARPSGVLPTNIVTLDQYNARTANVGTPAATAAAADEQDAEGYKPAPPRMVPAALSIRWILEDGEELWRTDGFPAVSLDGKQIAIEDRWHKGTAWPHLAIAVYDVTNRGLRKSKTMTILSDKELDDTLYGLELKIPRKVFDGRVARALAQLQNFRPAIPLVENYDFTHWDERGEHLRVFDFHIRVQRTMFQVTDRKTGWVAVQNNFATTAIADLPDSEPCMYGQDESLTTLSAYVAPDHSKLIVHTAYQAGPDYCSPEGRTHLVALTSRPAKR